MFILAFIAELIVNANWATIPHWALVITGILASAEFLTYVIGFLVVGSSFISIFKELGRK